MQWQLSLDFGTLTGFSVWARGQRMASGTWPLWSAAQARTHRKSGADLRAYDPRPATLAGFLFELCDFWKGPPSAVVFEDVQFATSTAQAQLWASLRAAAWFALVPKELKQSWCCIAPNTLKKIVTGNGHAEKPEMFAAMPAQMRQAFDVLGLDDNAVDAYWLGAWAGFGGHFQPLWTPPIKTKKKKLKKVE